MTMEERLAAAQREIHACGKQWFGNGSIGQKLKAWERRVQSRVMHGCRSWEMDASMAKRLRQWEMEYLRKTLKFMPKMVGGDIGDTVRS